MNEGIKKAIDDKYNSIVESYRINDESIQSRLDQWYGKMIELGGTASDVADFESKFTSSDLVREYSDIYMEITQKCELIDPIDEMEPDPDDDYFFEKQKLKDMKGSFLGSIPVVGSVLRTKNKIDYFKNRKNYDDDEDDE